MRSMLRPSGLNGAIPTVYDPDWGTYTDLSPAQIAAFQAFPQDLMDYASVQRWQAEFSGTAVTYNSVLIPLTTDDRSKALVIGMRQAVDDALVTSVSFIDASGNSHTLDVNGVKAVHGAIMTFVQTLFAAQVGVNAAITGATITKRSQIDAIYASIAPNSPSAKNPSPT